MSAPDGHGLRAIEAYRNACGTQPLLEKRGRPGTGVSLYCWGLKPTRDVRIPRTREVTLAVHLGGVRRVHVFTERGISRRFSRPGDITLIPRGQSIHYLIDGGVEFATMHLPQSASRIFGDRHDSSLLGLSDCLFAFRDDYALASVRALMRASGTSGSGARHYAAQVLESLALHLAHVVSSGSAEPVRLAQRMDETPLPARTIDFNALAVEIDGRLGECLSIRDLANLAGVGRSTFCEQFKAHFGVTPHHYLLGRKMARAKSLLEAGESNITAVSFELGFSSAAHFSTAFRSATGLSPRAYLESVRRHSRRRDPQRPA